MQHAWGASSPIPPSRSGSGGEQRPGVDFPDSDERFQRIERFEVQYGAGTFGCKIQRGGLRLCNSPEDAEKIFVFSTRGGTKEEDVDDLFDAMREIGPVTLLSVVEADLDHPAGTVLELRDGFLRGFIGAFSQDPWDPPLQAWLRICRNAIARITK